jgi:hypothetical protein
MQVECRHLNESSLLYFQKTSVEFISCLFNTMNNAGPPLWSSGQSSWLQIQRSGFDYRHYQIFWKVVGLERGPLSFVSTTEELLGRKSSGSGLENRDYGRKDPSCWPRGILYLQKLALTSPKSDGRSVGIVRSRTEATEVLWTMLNFHLTPWNWTLLENLPVTHLLKNFPTCYGTQKFITLFTRALHWPLSLPKSI